jgi:peptide/nickel transport system substrate-binding protein
MKKLKVSKAVSFALFFMMFLSTVAYGGGASSAGLLNVVTAAEPKALDPMCGATDRTSAAVYNNIYETLLKVDNSGKIVPNLASYKQIDDTTYKFNIQKGVKFHNGEELKANDVAFTMKKGAETPITEYIWGSIDTKSIKIIDDYTVQVKLKSPCSPFLALMTCNTAIILNAKYVKAVGDGSGTKPIGTGPYKFVEWKKGQSITLERFKDYHGVKPQAQKIVFRAIPEASNRTIELESGGCDIACDIPIADAKRVKGDSNLKLLKQTGNSIRYLGFNTAKAPFDKKKVRQAIASAIDIKGLVASVLQGTGTVATCPISPNLMFFDKSAKMRPYSVARAKKMLGDAGYPRGFKTTIWCDDKKDDVDIATIVQGQLAKIGVTADIKSSEWGAFINSAYSGEVALYIMDWSSASPDPDIIFNSVFNSKMLGQGGNVSRLVDSKVDELLQRGRSTFDNNKRVTIYKELQQNLYDLVPWVYLWVDDVYVGVNNRKVKSMVVSPLNTHPLYKVKLK